MSDSRQEADEMETTVKSATSQQKNELISIILAAFVTDPVARWLCPAAHQYFSRMGEFVDAFGGASFDHGSAYYVDGYCGAALWLPPKVQPNEEKMMTIIKDVVPEHRLDAAFSMFEKMGGFHPDEPHWYLPLIGVDPSCQARGYGSRLMTHALERCDREKKLAYLESSNPRKLSLYIRQGFELIATIQGGDSPPVFPMLRKPKELMG
jgi:ribosomal protein S18 acetylase RimI-like enzyme